MPSKIIDLIVVSSLFLLSILPSFIFSLPSLMLNIAWFIVPAAYLLIRERKNVFAISVAAFFIGLLALALDIFLSFNHAWEPYRSSFLLRIFGVPIEEIVWFFFLIFYILVWYEHFIDDAHTVGVTMRKQFIALVILSIAALGLALVAVYAFPDLSRIRYAYATLGLCAMAFILLYVVLKRRVLTIKIIPLAIFFFVFAFIMEIRALQFELWSFHDINDYLAMVNVFSVSFPIEEIIFWMLLGPSAAIAYYEVFADDGMYSQTEDRIMLTPHTCVIPAQAGIQACPCESRDLYKRGSGFPLARE